MASKNGLSTDRSKKRASIYREAAKLIESGAEYACCYALEKAGGKRECDRMHAVFAECQGRVYLGGHWMADLGENPYDRELMSPRRVVALCFMAAMVEAGDA
jgi:hypothetical protein